VSEHPKNRPAELADPLTMTASGVEGDPLLMLDCLVEEYSRMGIDAEQIVELFETPEFLATHGLRGHFGAEATRDRVRQVLSRCGVLRVRTTVVPALDPSTDCDPSNCQRS
jgi:hypothetical protein